MKQESQYIFPMPHPSIPFPKNTGEFKSQWRLTCEQNRFNICCFILEALTSLAMTFPFLSFILLLHLLFLCFCSNPGIVRRNCKRVLNIFYPATRTGTSRWARAMVRSLYPLKPRWCREICQCRALAASCSRRAWRWCCKFI